MKRVLVADGLEEVGELEGSKGVVVEVRWGVWVRGDWSAVERSVERWRRVEGETERRRVEVWEVVRRRGMVRVVGER